MSAIVVLFLGAFVTLVGAFIIANAAFSDRAQFGFYVAASGVVLFIGAVIEIATGALA